MIKIMYEGEIYYFNNGKIYDSSFMEIPQVISEKVLTQYYEKLNYENFDENEFLEYAKNLKSSRLFVRCIKSIEYAIKKFNNSIGFCKIVLPIATSCYRLNNQPQKAIDFWETKKETFGSCISAPLFTSLAAAYCDIQDYITAKKLANAACALSGGPDKIPQELIGVYSRIKAETKEYLLNENYKL